MKKVVILFSILVFLFSSCEKDEPSTSTGDPRDLYIGVWECQENSTQNGISIFDVIIYKSQTSSTQVLIENFYKYGPTFAPFAEVSGNSIVIPSQVIQGNIVQGSGTLQSTTINMSYTIDDGNLVVDNVTAVFTKK